MAKDEGQIESAKLQTSNEKSYSTRKRPNVESYIPVEETTNKRRRFNPSVATSSMLEVNEETKQSASSTDKNMKSIVDLPPEILLAILQNVASVDLLKCRETNRQWNELSSKVIRQRADIILKFGFEKGRFMRSIKYRHCEELLVNVCKAFHKYDAKSLADLVDCLRQSKHFPCTSFRFGSLANFESKDMKSFMSIWGNQISALNVSLDNNPKNAEVLKDLLLSKVTNLTKLELQFDQEKISSPIQLSVDSEGFELPNLEVLCVDSCYRKFRVIIEHILAAARNLKRFDLNKTNWAKFIVNMSPDIVHEEEMVDPRDSITADDFTMLQTLNKLHCLKNARIFITKDLIAYWQKSPSNFDLKLQTLALSVKPSIWACENLKSRTTEMINQLFCSSKNVMQELSIEPMGSLPGLVIPMLGNLQKLHLFGWLSTHTGTKNINVFPPLFEMADNFPKLKELDMHGLDENTFPQSLKPMENVEVLRLFGGESLQCKEMLMKASPNAKTLLMVEDDFPWANNKVLVNFGAIAENLTKLESFGWTICRFGYQELLHLLDAAVTGFPEKFCKKMSAKFRNKDNIPADELAAYQLKRSNPSILDLHELKQLDVNFFFDFDHYCETKHSDECNSDCENSDCDGECGGGSDEGDDDGGINAGSVLYETGFSNVSKLLAFDLMPKLKIRTHKRFE